MASRGNFKDIRNKFNTSKADIPPAGPVKNPAKKALESIFKSFRNRGQKKLRILVTGKTGQGKSTLVNGILGAKVAKEGARAKRCTTVVEKYCKTINGIPIRVYDSPGLQDRTANEEEYIHGMREKCKELSLVLYCTKMNNTRLGDDDKNAMMKLTRAFGEKFWNYAVFVLTFANMEDATRNDDRDDDEPEPDDDDDEGWKRLERTRFTKRLELWEEELQNFLINEVGVSSEIARGIPVVPTGDHKRSRKNPQPFASLPDRDDWFIKFWEVCCLRVKDTYLFLQVNADRMEAKDEGYATSADRNTAVMPQEDISEKEKRIGELEKLIERGGTKQKAKVFEEQCQPATVEQPVPLRRHSTISRQVHQKHQYLSKRLSGPADVSQKSQTLPSKTSSQKYLKNEEDPELAALLQASFTPSASPPVPLMQTEEWPISTFPPTQREEWPVSTFPLAQTEEWPVSLPQTDISSQPTVSCRSASSDSSHSTPYSSPTSSPPTPHKPNDLSNRKAQISSEFVEKLTVETIGKEYGEEVASTAAAVLKDIPKPTKWFTKIFKRK